MSWDSIWLKMINIKKKIASEKEKKAANPSPLGRRPSVRSQLLTKGVSNLLYLYICVKSVLLTELPELQRNLPSKWIWIMNVNYLFVCLGTCKLYHPNVDNLAFFRLYIQPGNVWIEYLTMDNMCSCDYNTVEHKWMSIYR